MMMNPGGGPMGAAGGMADMMRKNMQQMKQRMGGEVGGAVPPGLGMMAGGYAAGAMQSEPLVPDKCLVRFVDITVQPGHTYEYQVRVRMGNPLYQKPEKAISLEFTKDKEVTGEWARIPHKLTVPEETEFYVVDERTTKSRSAVSQDQLPMQIHRWFDWMQIAQNVREAIVPVGDWTIAERVPVARGEYIGTMKEVEVPTWYPLQEAFGFAVPPEQRRKNYTRPRGGKGIKVPFGTQSILIDFQGGRQEVAVKGRDTKVRDECPVEALILTPDGKLRLRSSKADTELATRKERVKHWHEWLKEVKEGKERKPAQDNLFGPPGAAGGAGAGANNN
jgi:hypothetical protein